MPKTASTHRPFLYLRDPLFVTAFSLYFLNRLVFRPLQLGSFFHDHFNDLICIPFWAPIAAWLLKISGLRPRPLTPQPIEILAMVITMSVVFEVVLPAIPWFRGRTTPDLWDINFYLGGAIGGVLFWNRYYSPSAGNEVSEKSSTEY